MKFTSAHRQTLRAILDGTYTPLDVREFVQLCYTLALPLIRSRIARGKLNLDALGLAETDVVYDCVADLFRRDAAGDFVQVKSFIAHLGIDITTCHDDEAALALRRLVFGKVHNAIIRLHSDVDPTLGKILRNMMLELENSELFEHVARFGETYLVARTGEPSLHLPPAPAEFLRQQFSQVVSVRDSIPVMIEKLHGVLLSQEEFQRTVPLLTAGLLFKEAYALGSEAGDVEECSIERQCEADDICRIAEQVCRMVSANARQTYVDKGKRSMEVFDKYMDAVKAILLSEFGGDGSGNGSYYEHLKASMPGLAKGTYSRRHRAILEYLAKRAKNQMKEEMRKM